MAKLKNQQHEHFAQLYVANGRNATQAAIKAKYSEKTAYSQGQRLLKNVEVKNRINQLSEKHCDKLEVDAENVITSILAIRETCAKEVEVEKKDGTKLKVCVDAKSALKANELLGKYLDILSGDKDNDTQNIGTQVNFYIPQNGREG